MNIKNIVFFNNHVNGDCFISRIFVNQIIKYFPNCEYYYTSFRSLVSHCEDLGISSNNFNVKNIPLLKHIIFDIIDETLFIDTWIGNLHLVNNNIDDVCSFCLKNFINFYNSLISKINNMYDLQIPNIDTYDPYLAFNYEYYDCIFLKDYVNEQKKIYKKIILYYDFIGTTFIININHNNILCNLANNFNDYLFIAYNSNYNLKNVISIKEIYDTCNKKKELNLGIQFSYLFGCVDKVISIPSGISQFFFPNIEKENNNNKIKTDILMILDYSPNSNPNNCKICNLFHIDYINADYLCMTKYNKYINLCKYSNNEKLYENIYNFIK